ncbi:MAG: geranylgeranylglycerol-phosphate geranylgeranyltransferase [Saprospiraceae bacterium]|jgi:4-hydroxybenzoate polyprenyltransferase
MHWITFLRVPNLVIVALTQWVFGYVLIYPALQAAALAKTMDHLQFALLSAATLCLTAGGYLINDLSNIEGDRINRPGRALPSGKVDVATAQWWYAVTSLGGFLCSALLSFQLGREKLLFLYPLAWALLYWYSRRGQRLPLVGNLLVALFCAGVSSILWAAEWPALQNLAERVPLVYRYTKALFIWYASFAFLSNLFRELVKDIEDLQGDLWMGMHTLPVVVGPRRAKIIAVFIGLLLLVLLAFQAWGQDRALPVILLCVGTGLPLGGAIVLLYFSTSKRQVRWSGYLIKTAMLGGLASVFAI